MLTLAQVVMLQNELATDPASLGYAPHVAASHDGTLADLINSVSVLDVDRRLIPTYEILGATVSAEFAVLGAADKQWYQLMIAGGQIDVSNANVRNMLQNMFAGGTQTRANLVALIKRKGSRAEQLFGLGFLIDASMIAQALGRGV